jgi:protein-tyrosine phosphatase
MISPMSSISQPTAGHGRGVRIPKLSGALNFRDLGGYPATDGRTVKWNHLYRSGTTHAMTSEDLEFVLARGIRCACDLRSNSERARHPSRLRGIADLEYWFHDSDRPPGDLSRLVKEPNARPERTRELMVSLYRDLPYKFRDTYRALFVKLAEGRMPLVFNCTAGKDRTGVAAALVLTALGVERAVVLEDYLLTEQFFEQCCLLHTLPGPDTLPFRGIAREVWEPMMRTDAAYLDAMFDQLAAAYGSTDNYLSRELGLDAVLIDRLREQLLESAPAPETAASGGRSA